MPKIDPNCLKDYLADLRKDRSRGRGFDSEQSVYSARSIQQSLIRETLEACNHSIRTLNTFHRELPKIQFSVTELLSHNNPSESIHPYVSKFMQNLRSICNHYYRQTITGRDGIIEISQQLQHRPLRTQRLLEKRILIMRRYTLPVVGKITKLLNELNLNLNASSDQKGENGFTNQAPIHSLISKINGLGAKARQQNLFC